MKFPMQISFIPRNVPATLLLALAPALVVAQTPLSLRSSRLDRVKTMEHHEDYPGRHRATANCVSDAWKWGGGFLVNSGVGHFEINTVAAERAGMMIFEAIWWLNPRSVVSDVV